MTPFPVKRYATGGVLDLLNDAPMAGFSGGRAGAAQKRIAIEGAKVAKAMQAQGQDDLAAKAMSLSRPSTGGRAGRRDQAIEMDAMGLLVPERAAPPTQPAAPPPITAMPTGGALGFEDTAAQFGKMYGRSIEGLANTPTTGSAVSPVAPTFGVGSITLSNGTKTDLTPGYSKGGKIVGPGTGTSDSIPAKVGGKPLAVSNGEYILPKSVVDAIGVDTLDELVRRINGKEPGPTIDGQGKMKAVLGGMMPTEEYTAKRLAEAKAAAAATIAASQFNGEINKGVKYGTTGYDGSEEQAADKRKLRMFTAPVEPRVEKIKESGHSPLQKLYTDMSNATYERQGASDPNFGMNPSGTPKTITSLTADASGAVNQAVPKAQTAPVASQVGQANGTEAPTAEQVAGAAAERNNKNIAALRAAGVNGTVGGNSQRGGIQMLDTPNGKVYSGRDAKGQLNVVSNLNQSPEELEAGRVKEANRIMTDLRERVRQATINNLMTDAFDPSITDPRVQANARAKLQAMGLQQQAQGAQQQAQEATGVARERLGIERDRAMSEAERGRFVRLDGEENVDPGTNQKTKTRQRLWDTKQSKFVDDGQQAGGQSLTFANKAELQAAIKAGHVKAGQTINTPNGPMVVK